MSEPGDSPPAMEKASGEGGVGHEPHRFGLTSATALIIGTIVGVGIFNLPTSLATYGPISLVSMALTTAPQHPHRGAGARTARRRARPRADVARAAS